jgi:hypothetical protein
LPPLSKPELTGVAAAGTVTTVWLVGVCAEKLPEKLGLMSGTGTGGVTPLPEQQTVSALDEVVLCVAAVVLLREEVESESIGE